ncbi:MAG: hypothetical protein IPP19_13330 [Verrucomicrobia bacterium]|nr:hypothetical protein [Verrucomicrobiota bacterium]
MPIYLQEKHFDAYFHHQQANGQNLGFAPKMALKPAVLVVPLNPLRETISEALRVSPVLAILRVF